MSIGLRIQRSEVRILSGTPFPFFYNSLPEREQDVEGWFPKNVEISAPEDGLVNQGIEDAGLPLKVGG